MTISYSAQGLINTIAQNGYKYTNAYTASVTESVDEVEKLQENFEDFREAVRSLHNYSSSNTTDDKLKTYLTKLKDTYNTLVKNKDSITDSSLQKQLDKLDTLIEDNEKSFKKLGIKKTNGKLTFDEDTFDDDADQKTIDKLFTGTDSFIDKTYKLLRKIDKSAADARYVTTERRLGKATKYDKQDIINAQACVNTQENTSYLNKCNSYIQDSDIQEAAIDLLKLLPDSINQIENNEKYIDLCKENEENLEKLGITYDEDENKLTYTETAIDTAAFNTLFNDSEGSFYNTIKGYCKEDYITLLKPDSIGAIIDDTI